MPEFSASHLGEPRLASLPLSYAAMDGGRDASPNSQRKMTGKSLPWKAHGEERERMLTYYKKLASGFLIVGGSFLLFEHLFQFGGFDIELFGHEIYGLILIATGFLIALKWHQLPSLIKAIKSRDWWAILDEGERKKYKQEKTSQIRKRKK